MLGNGARPTGMLSSPGNRSSTRTSSAGSRPIFRTVTVNSTGSPTDGVGVSTDLRTSRSGAAIAARCSNTRTAASTIAWHAERMVPLLCPAGPMRPLDHERPRARARGNQLEVTGILGDQEIDPGITGRPYLACIGDRELSPCVVMCDHDQGLPHPH